MLKMDVSGLIGKNGETLVVSLMVSAEDIAEDDPWFQDKVSVVGSIANVGSCLRLQLQVAGRALSECSRCLQRLDSEFSFALDEDIEAGEIDLATGSLDLTEILRTALVFHQPMQPLCKPECLGLCPHCGTDRNQLVCGCDSLVVDPRLEKLGQLFIK